MNRALVEERLALISSCLADLARLGGLGPEAFLRNKDTVAAAESYLRRCLEAVFDVGRHVLAISGHVGLAAEYRSIAAGLHRLGIVDEQLSQSLAKMAGYRNRLVHLYALVTPEELWDTIETGMGDIRAFVEQVGKFLASRGPD